MYSALRAFLLAAFLLGLGLALLFDQTQNAVRFGAAAGVVMTVEVMIDLWPLRPGANE